MARIEAATALSSIGRPATPPLALPPPPAAQQSADELPVSRAWYLTAERTRYRQQLVHACLAWFDAVSGECSRNGGGGGGGGDGADKASGPCRCRQRVTTFRLRLRGLLATHPDPFRQPAEVAELVEHALQIEAALCMHFEPGQCLAKLVVGPGSGPVLTGIELWIREAQSVSLQ